MKAIQINDRESDTEQDITMDQTIEEPPVLPPIDSDFIQRMSATPAIVEWDDKMCIKLLSRNDLEYRDSCPV